MPRIDKIRLRCHDPTAQRAFYQDVLGMGSRGNGVVACGTREAGLQFEPALDPYRPSDPHQFQDIGCLAHFQDPEGLTVELIEHWFHGNRSPRR